MRISAALTIALLVAAFASGATPAAAQEAFARPRLAASADTNSWSAYFDAGVAELRRDPVKAEACFYWASELDPSRAEPLHARWVAFHLASIHRWEDYMRGRAQTLRDPMVQAHDSVRYMAAVRNPFVHRGLELVLYDQLQGRFEDTQLSHGVIEYAKPNLPSALRYLSRVGRGDAEDFRTARNLRAQAFVAMGQYDSAAVELTMLRQLASDRDRATLVRRYESKAMLDYSLGLLYAAANQPDRARETLQQAVLEDASFYPAHLWLGDLALNADDAAAAAREFEAAIELAPEDPVLEYHYGIALQGLGRLAAAVAVFRQATTLAPSYAAPWFELARTLDRGNDPQAAREAYAAFLARAPREAAKQAAAARERLAALMASR